MASGTAGEDKKVEAAKKRVGLRVAELRRASGETQQQLAERANITVKYLQRIEAGSENLTISSLVSLAGLLGVEVVVLFDAPRSKRPPVGRPRKS